LLRRLDRWGKSKILGVVGTNRVQQPKPKAVNGHEEKDERPARVGKKRKSNGSHNTRANDIPGSDDEKGPDDLDEVDKEILGLGGDDTDEDVSEGGMEVDSGL
jgi:Ino eighty subunit 1